MASCAEKPCNSSRLISFSRTFWLSVLGCLLFAHASSAHTSEAEIKSSGPAAARRVHESEMNIEGGVDTFDSNALPLWNLHQVSHLSDLFPHLQPLPSPLKNTQSIVRPGEGVIKSILVDAYGQQPPPTQVFLRSGPRDQIFHNPRTTRAAIVTCGGICPGLNTVIRELVNTLWDQYGVRDIWGIHGGFQGFYQGEWEPLTPKSVDRIHTLGGSVLSSSRGGFDRQAIMEALREHNVTMLFVVGGDGTLRGAQKIANLCAEAHLPVSVAGLPKTVDNDIPIIDRSFGFETAVEEARRAIDGAHVEATSFPNGVGIVQLMGRNSGFIALHAAIAARDVDCVLIPEIDFQLMGDDGLFKFIEQRLKDKGHAVIVVAEGSGQSEVRRQLGVENIARDPSGNNVLVDVGAWLRQQMKDHFQDVADPSVLPVSVKYIDPTYMVRSIAPNAADNVYCTKLAQGAVHGTFAGYTNFMVGPINTHHSYIPLHLLTNRTNVVAVTGQLWNDVLASTGQPHFPSTVTSGCEPGSDTTWGGCTVAPTN